MVENRSAGVSLFELLARGWIFNEEIAQVEFSRNDTVVLFRLLSGKLALISTSDTESPKSRTRIEVDTGRTTIQQRKEPVPAPQFAYLTAKTDFPIVQWGGDGFLALDDSNAPYKITIHGQNAATAVDNSSSITSICSDHTGELLAIARGPRITVHQGEDMDLLLQARADRDISNMSFSATSQQIATWGEDCLTIIDIRKSSKPPIQIHGISNVMSLGWDHSGKYIACASSKKEFHIVDTQARTFHKVQDYPSAVNLAMFSEKAKALITSGAYRLAGWSTDDLPQANHAGTPLISGKPGLIPVTAIAAHPSRTLAASGYANGLVTISNIGTSQEMMVHQEAGTQVSHLVWSGTGEHLAIGFDSGKAAIVTFPDQLFK